MVVARRRASQHRQRLIDVLGLLVAGNDSAGRVCFFDEVVAVIGVDAGGTGRRFEDSSSEGVVFEAKPVHAKSAYSLIRHQPSPRDFFSPVPLTTQNCPRI
jgi:hypothetical protein